MKIKYLGPSPSIRVGVLGTHITHVKGQIIDYPDEVGEDLLRDKKNNFEAMTSNIKSSPSPGHRSPKKTETAPPGTLFRDEVGTRAPGTRARRGG